MTVRAVYKNGGEQEFLLDLPVPPTPHPWVEMHGRMDNDPSNMADNNAPTNMTEAEDAPSNMAATNMADGAGLNIKIEDQDFFIQIGIRREDFIVPRKLLIYIDGQPTYLDMLDELNFDLNELDVYMTNAIFSCLESYKFADISYTTFPSAELNECSKYRTK